MGLDKNRNMPETLGSYCLYALAGVLPLVFVYQTFDIFELSKLTFLRLTTLVMIAAWVLMCYRERRFIVARTPIDYFILAYLAVFTAATVLSGNPRMSLLGEYGRFEGLLTIYNYAAVFFLAGIFIRENKLIGDTGAFVRNLALTAIGTASLVSFYGVLQRFGLDFLFWSSAGTDTTRAFSTLGNPLYVAAYLTIIISVAVGMFAAEVASLAKNQPPRNDVSRSRAKRYAPVVGLGIAIVLMFSTLVLTFSRAGWGGMVVSIAVLGAFAIATRVQGVRRERGVQGQGRMPHRANSSTVAMTERSKQRQTQIPIYFALVVAVLVVTSGLVALSAGKASGPTKSAMNRVLSVFDFNGPAYADRVSMWKSSIAMIKDKPILGFGPDMFGTYYTQYRRLDIVKFERNVNGIGRPRYQNRPHMDILQQGVSAGILGMLTYASMWGAFFWFAIRRVLAASHEATGKSMPSSSSRLTTHASSLMPIGIIAGLVGYLFQIQFSFGTIAVTPLAWLLMAIVFALSNVSVPRTVVRRVEAKSDVLPAIGLTVILAVIGFSAIISFGPIVADYYFDQGVTAYENKDSFVAQDNFELAESFNPYEPEYPNYAATGFVEFAKQTTDANGALVLLLKSIDFANRAIKLNPEAAGFRFNLGNAEFYYSTIPDMDPVEAERTMKDALKNFLFAADNDPYMADYRFNLASAYMRFSKKKEAIEQIKAGLKIDPTRLDAKAWLATLEKGAGL